MRFFFDDHLKEDCLFLKRASKIKKKYSKLVKREKGVEGEMLADKKLSAVVPCLIECLNVFGTSVTKNAPLAISQLRREVQAMRLPQRVLALPIIEQVISVFLSSGMYNGAFSSKATEENTTWTLVALMEKFYCLMDNMRMDIDDL